jgi:hypothetical protein
MPRNKVTGENSRRFAVGESGASATRSGGREAAALSQRGGCRSVRSFVGTVMHYVTHLNLGSEAEEQILRFRLDAPRHFCY